MATPFWLSGFEYGLATPVVSGGGLFATITGSPTISSSIKKTGGYSLRIYNATAATNGATPTIPGEPDVVIGKFDVYFADAWPGATTKLICIYFEAGATARVYIDPATQKIGCGFSGGTAQYANKVLSLNTWYRVDFKVNASANPNVIDVQVDGTASNQANFAQAATHVNNVYFGDVITATVKDIYFDNAILSATAEDYPIGACEIEGLRPADDVDTEAPGTNSLESSDGTDISYAANKGFQYLDENPWVSTANADYVRGTLNTLGDNDHCDIAFADTAEATILGVRALLQYASASTSANLGAAAIFDSNGQKTVLWGDPTGTRADYSETSAFYKSAQVATPSGGWTKDHVNGLVGKIGYYTDGNPDVYWLAMMLEVAYAIAQGEPHSGSAVVSGKGSVVGTVKKSGLGAALASAKGAIVALGVAAMMGVAALSGGGDSVAAGQKNAYTHTPITDIGAHEYQGVFGAAASAGGSVTAVGEKGVEQHSGAGAISGGGAVSTSGDKAGQTSIVVSGGGSLNTTGTKAAYTHIGIPDIGGHEYQGYFGAVVYGGGTITATGEQAGVEEHSGSAVIPGGGSLVAVGEKASQDLAIISAGGTVVSTGQKSASDLATISGGGSIVASGTVAESHSGDAIISAGGTIAGSALKAGAGTGVISGAGNPATLGTKAASATALVSGGGSIITVPLTGIKYMTVKEDIGFRERTLTSEHSHAEGGKDIVIRWLQSPWNTLAGASTTWNQEDKRAK